MKKKNIGIIGAGYWASNIIKTIENISNTYELYVFDISDFNLKQIKKNFPKVEVITKESVFFSIDYFAIFVISPPDTHFYYAKKCLVKKNHVFLEKPGTLSYSNLNYLHKLSMENKKFLMVGYLYRFNVYIDYIKKILKKKLLGEIKYITIERLNLGPVRNSYSCFWDLASHDIFTLIYIFKEKLKIKKVIGHDFLKKNIFDLGYIFLKIKKINIEIKSSWLSPEKIRKYIFVGSKKMLLFDEMDRKYPVKIYNKYANYPNIKSFKKSDFSPKANIFLGKTYIPKIKFSAPLENEIKFFMKIINSPRNFKKYSIKEALKVAQILEKIHLNIKNN